MVSLLVAIAGEPVVLDGEAPVGEAHDVPAEEPQAYLGAAALGPASEIGTTIEQSPAVTFLNALRANLRPEDRTIPKGRIVPEPYEPAMRTMLRIRELHAGSDPAQALTETETRRLLVCAVRFRQETGLEAHDSPRLSGGFLSELYSAYHHDLSIFRSYPLRRAELITLLHSPDVLQTLEQRCAANGLGKQDVVYAFDTRRSDPVGALDQLVADVTEFMATTEPKLRATYGFEGSWSKEFVTNLCRYGGAEYKARRVFGAMRTILENYPHTPLATAETWARKTVEEKGRRGTPLAIMLEKPPRITWHETDLASATEQLNRIRHAKREGWVEGWINQPQWNANVSRLAQLLTANWQDCFEHIDPPRDAGRIWHAVTAYNGILSENEAALGISLEPQNLYGLLVAYANDVIALEAEMVPSAAARVAWSHDPIAFDRYKQAYQGDLLVTPAIIVATIKRYAASEVAYQLNQWRERMQQIQRFEPVIMKSDLQRLAFLPNAEAMAKRCANLIREASTEYPWVRRSEVASFFVTGRNPEADFRRWARKVEKIAEDPSCQDLTLVQRRGIAKGEGGPKQVVKDYRLRVKRILDAHPGDDDVARYASGWAINNPDTYLDVANNYVLLVPAIGELLQGAGVTVDRATLGHLASKYGDRSASAIAKAYAKKVQAAAEEASHKQTASGPQPASSRQKAPPSQIVREGSTTPSPGARRLQELAPFLQWLAPLDRQAISMVLQGSIDSPKKAAIAQELGVDDLDDYVTKEALPYLMHLIRIRRTQG